MKPHGLKYSQEGCLCSLCRSRGYRKGDEYDSWQEVCKATERQKAKKEIKKELDNNEQCVLQSAQINEGVAQLDSARDFYSLGWGFESLRLCQIPKRRK